MIGAIAGEASKILGIRFLDHVLIGDPGRHSSCWGSGELPLALSAQPGVKVFVKPPAKVLLVWGSSLGHEFVDWSEDQLTGGRRWRQ